MTRRTEPPLWTDLTFGLGFTLKAVAIYFLVGAIWTHKAGGIDNWTLAGQFILVASIVGLGAALSRWAWGKRVSSTYSKRRSRG